MRAEMHAIVLFLVALKMHMLAAELPHSGTDVPQTRHMVQGLCGAHEERMEKSDLIVPTY